MDEKNEQDFGWIRVPKEILGKDSVTPHTTKDGNERAFVKLPPHTEIVLPSGNKADLSFGTINVSAKSVFSKDEDKYVSVSLPRFTGTENEPWIVNISKNLGATVNGDWKSDGTATYKIPTDSFVEQMNELHNERKAFAQSHAEAAQSAPATEKAEKKASTLNANLGAAEAASKAAEGAKKDAPSQEVSLNVDSGVSL